ncbi:MAG: AMP-binding protein, partial [Candidatus Aminicenantes bacterium]
MKKLNKKNIEDILMLTPMQQGMLFHYLKEPGSDLYFEQLSLDIAGEIDLTCFEQAWNFVVETNEMLRTMFRWENLENPIQVVLKEHFLKPVYYDVSDEDHNKPEKSLTQIKARDRNERFHLGEVPFRVTLCKIEKNRYELIVSNHHILYDGWSYGIILKEFFQAYHYLSNGEELVLPVKTKFKEFVKWIRNRDLEKEKTFWRDYLRSFDTLSQLSIKRSRKREEITTTYTKSCQLRFGVDLKGKLEDFVKNYSITLASLLYTAWGVLLQKYNNSNDVVFGTTVSGRSAKIEGIENMVGLFINTLPLRIQTEYNETTRDLLQRTDQTLRWREVVEHSSLPEIKKYCDMGNREELFDSIVIIENYPLDRGLVRGNRDLSIDSYAMKEMTHYDLTLSIMAFDEIQLQVVYTGDLFADKSIERLCHHFRDIVETIIKDPDQLVADIEIVSEEEKNQLLFDFNNTKAGYPADQEIHELFEEQAGRTPDHIALVGHLHLEGTRGLAPLLSAPLSISYQELNKKSEQLASSLKQKGVQTGTIVAIMVERSIEMVIGILGILKASAAYLPIDPDYPQDRIDYMLADSKAHMLLIDNPSRHFNCQLPIVNCQLS